MNFFLFSRLRCCEKKHICLHFWYSEFLTLCHNELGGFCRVDFCHEGSQLPLHVTAVDGICPSSHALELRRLPRLLGAIGWGVRLTWLVFYESGLLWQACSFSPCVASLPSMSPRTRKALLAHLTAASCSRTSWLPRAELSKWLLFVTYPVSGLLLQQRSKTSTVKHSSERPTLRI